MLQKSISENVHAHKLLLQTYSSWWYQHLVVNDMVHPLIECGMIDVYSAQITKKTSRDI